MEHLTQEQTTRLNVIKAKLRNLHPKIKNILEQGRMVATDPSKLFLFKGMFKGLNTYFADFNATWDQMIEFSHSHDISNVLPSENDKKCRDAVESCYYEACAIHEQYMNPTPTAASNTTMLNTALNSSRTVRARLPEINLPKFDGTYSNWPLFRDTFTSLIHDESMLSNIEKFHFLLSCLSGPALSLVKGVTLSEANYPQAWKLLTDTYDDKRRLASSYLKTVLNFAPFRNKPTASSLKHFLSTVTEAIASFQQLKVPKADEFILLFLALRCLDTHTRREFEKKHSQDQFPSYQSLMDFLKAELRSLELTSEDSQSLDNRPHGSTTRAPNSTPSNRFHSSLFTDHLTSCSSGPSSFSSGNTFSGSRPTQGRKPSLKNSCPVCKAPHTLYQCVKFKTSTPQGRLSYLKGWQGCSNCLSSRHKKGRCTSTRTCQTCGLKHHSWLHVDPAANSPPAPAGTSSADPPATVNLSGVTGSSSAILGTALIQVKDAQGKYQVLRAVADSGSKHAYITTAWARKLGLQTSPFPFQVGGLGRVPVPQAREQLSCILRSRFGKHQFHTTAVVIPEITWDLPHSPIPKEFHSLVRSYPLADPSYWKPQPVDFLIGADIFYDIIDGRRIELKPGFPKMIPTLFGYLVGGSCQNLEPSVNSTSLLATAQPDIKEVMSKFWEIEEIPKEVPLSDEEIACENHFASTHYRLPSGRFVVALPVRSTIDHLSSPIQQVEGRFKKLEQRLNHNPFLKTEYHNFMKEYLLLDHMAVSTKPGRYLIPHHCVTKQEGNQTKIRVVFDASCKGLNGSLNDHVMTGPKLQSNICDIVLNFRLHKIVLVADIVKMYRQVLIRPEDRPYQRILWRFNNLEPALEYELNTVTYGIASSAFLAIRALRQLAEDDGQDYPLAAQALLHDVYVDDIVSGADSFEEALLLQTQLIQLLQKGCFELSKWKSNEPALLESVPCEQPDSFALNPEDDCTSYKILGLQWIPSDDNFVFLTQKPTSPLTKRGILSTIARIFDPLGYLSPVVFQAKTILQEVWLSKSDWDDHLPDALRVSWESFASRLSDLSEVKIPRYVPAHEGTNFILGFADASQRGYAAVIYLHVRSSVRHQTYLLKSKTKLAPTKLSTIPRLELCAALLLSRLLHSCSSFISKIDVESTYLFTDSTVVLHWLSTPASRLKAFVAHRVTEIRELTKPSSWMHIESSHNPADCASRGLMPDELPHHRLWWSGPSWLTLRPSEWPIRPRSPTQENIPELKPLETQCLLTDQCPSVLDWISCSSSYMKTLRSLCFALRFVSRCRKLPTPMGVLTLKEIREANLLCIRLIQGQHLPPLKSLQTSPPWKSLCPFLDDAGLLRVGGRLHNANLPYDAKHPIILPKCHFTNLLVRHYHESFLHIGPTSLQAMVQRRYFLQSARKVIRSCTRRCVICQRAQPRVQPPFMGNIPPSRLQEGQVFQNVGVDLGGPFPLKESNRRKAALGKAYLCLFICMVTKALHLEVVSSCSTEAFLAALNRFVARRGRPQNIYSDCGSNFIGATSALKELKEWYRSKATQDEIHDFAAKIDIDWHLIPPHSPHFGGLWEAGIKSAKSLLAKNLSNTPLTFEELSTLFCRIEAVLNSRPLCPLSGDSEILDCLTPGHFLIGRPLNAMPEKSLLHLKENTLRRWQFIQQRLQHFWTRWRLEYLNQLQQRRKWTHSNKNLQPGDLVILKDSNAPPAVWPLARVVATHPGNDGIVRVATIRTSSGVYKRPAIKLVPLRLPEHESN